MTIRTQIINGISYPVEIPVNTVVNKEYVDTQDLHKVDVEVFNSTISQIETNTTTIVVGSVRPTVGWWFKEV